MKSLFKTLTFSVLFLLSSFAYGSGINVLRMSQAGAGGALWTEAVYETLKNQGYDATIIPTSSCREAANWIKANPGKSVVYATFSDYAIMDIVNPEHPAACGLPINEETLITIVGRWWNFICGHADKAPTVDTLVKQSNAKVGVWNHPISQSVAKQYLDAIGFKGNVVGFASGKQQMLAFTANDLDYIILSSENLAKSLPNATCFATTASPENAKAYMPERISYASVAPNVPHINYGLWPYIAGLNVNAPALRKHFNHSPGPLYQKLASNLVLETKTTREQLDDLHKVASHVKPLFTQP